MFSLLTFNFLETLYLLLKLKFYEDLLGLQFCDFLIELLDTHVNPMYKECCEAVKINW